MVKLDKATQFLGFDYNDYVPLQTSQIPIFSGGLETANGRWFYVAGTAARFTALSALMVATPPPTPGGPVTSIGPQYAWPYHGGVPGPTALLPINTAPVQRTTVSYTHLTLPTILLV